MLVNPDLIQVGKNWPIETRTKVQTLTIPGTVSVIQTGGYSTPGDGGGAEYKRVVAEPAHDGKVQSLDGAWFEYVMGDNGINVKAFGAKGDRSTPDTAAISSAIAYANTIQPIGEVATNQRVSIWHPDGGYYIDGALTSIVKSGVYITGSEGSMWLIANSFTGTVLTWLRTGGAPDYTLVGGGASIGCVEYVGGLPNASARVFQLTGTNRFNFSNMNHVNVSTLIRIGVAGGYSGVNVTLSNVNGGKANVGSSLISCQNGALLTIDATCNSYVEGVVTPVINRTSNTTVVGGCNHVSFVNGPWDTAYIAGLHERYYNGINIVTGSGGVCLNVDFTKAEYDYCGEDAVFVNVSSGGNVATLTGSGAWLAPWGGSAVALNGAGSINGVFLHGLEVPFTGEYGIRVFAANTRNLQISYGSYTSINRRDVNCSVIAIVDGVTDFNITGVVGDKSSADFPWQAQFGYYGPVDADNCNVEGNDLEGITFNYVIATDTVASANRRITNNRNANYAGNISSCVYTLPASTVVWTNKSGFNVEVILYGSTFTAYKNGVQISSGVTGDSVTMTLAPNDNYSVTYTGAPFVQYFIKP